MNRRNSRAVADEYRAAEVVLRAGEPTTVVTLLGDATWWSSASTCRGHACRDKKDTVGVPIVIGGAASPPNDVVGVRVKTGPRGRAGIESILTQSGVPVGVAAFIGRDRAKVAGLPPLGS
jgi:hypothetical protein